MAEVRIVMDGWRCERCGHEWVPQKPGKPRVCQACTSRLWDVPRTASKSRATAARAAKVARAERVRNEEREWAEMLRSGVSVRAIAAQAGSDQSTVSRRLRSAGIDVAATSASGLRERRAAEKQAAKQASDLERLLAAMDAATRRPPCAVCGAWIIRQAGGPPAATCSTECADRWTAGRYHFSDDQYDRHRRQSAASILRHPEGKRPAQIAWARRMLSDDPPPPNRRYAVAGSLAATAAGITVLPRTDTPVPTCGAISVDGTPCRRRVTNGGVCHMHQGTQRAQSAASPMLSTATGA